MIPNLPNQIERKQEALSYVETMFKTRTSKQKRWTQCQFQSYKKPNGREREETESSSSLWTPERALLGLGLGIAMLMLGGLISLPLLSVMGLEVLAVCSLCTLVHILA